jgi:hypothetical protein
MEWEYLDVQRQQLEFSEQQQEWNDERIELVMEWEYLDVQMQQLEFSEQQEEGNDERFEPVMELV